MILIDSSWGKQTVTRCFPNMKTEWPEKAGAQEAAQMFAI